MSTATSSLSRLQELLPQLFETPDVQGEPYLRCQLTPQISGLVSMEFVQESLLVPGEQITFIPNMPSFVMGLMTSRDRVFLLIDLSHRLGLSSPCPLLQTYQIIVLRISSLMSQTANPNQEMLLGFVVPRIQGVMRVMSEQIIPSQPDISSQLNPYIRGNIMESGKSLPILNLAAVVDQTINQS
ncbi:MAG: chemotaxis protein CheW [Crocosphaera sp.]|nr:chemotaxis protein CheW [Crocosphaera sp.]